MRCSTPGLLQKHRILTSSSCVFSSCLVLLCWIAVLACCLCAGLLYWKQSNPVCTGTPVQHRESFVATLALQSSSAARLQRSTHLTTLNMASVEEEEGIGSAASSGGLPLSQTAFKVRIGVKGAL